MRHLTALLALVAGLAVTACAAPSSPPAGGSALPVPDAPVAAPSAAPASLATTEPQAGVLDEAAWDEVLKTWTEPGNEDCDAPGVVLLVDSPAGRYARAAGVASLADKRPLEVGDRLEIGSNTKAFTVILALQAQEDGLLSLDDPLSKWLPDLAARIPNGEAITLRQLAGNTSGIADFADPMMQPVIDANDRVGLVKGYAPEELVDFAVRNGEPTFAPGEGWHYSSTNFILLGMVVEAATGKSVAELYRERIFDPLGMTNSSYLTGSPAPGTIVDGYYKRPDGLTDMTAWNGSQGGAAGAIVSTAEDMARFANGLFEGKLFKKEQTLAEMIDFRTLTAEEGGGLFAGYGLGLISFAAPGFTAIGHGGQTPGFQSAWFRVPESHTTVVLLTNSGTCRALFLPMTVPAAKVGK